MKEQENPTDDLLGAVAEEAKKQAKALGEELNGGETVQDEEEEEQEEEEDAQEHQQETSRENSNQAGDEAGEEAGEEDASDMEIAWEALEVCLEILKDNFPPRWQEKSSKMNKTLSTISNYLRFSLMSTLPRDCLSVGLRVSR